MKLKSNRKTPITRLLGVMVLLAGVGLGGCGAGSDESLWDEALQVYLVHQGTYASAAAANFPEAVGEMHGDIAAGLHQVLDRHPDADEDLRRVLGAMRDAEQQLADGEINVSSAEAEAIRERHAEYWSHLQERRLPPDYR